MNSMTRRHPNSIAALQQPEVLYLDFFTGSLDHAGPRHERPCCFVPGVAASLTHSQDASGQRSRTAPLADQTIFAVVSDHGMNNVPGVISQTFSLPDLFNSPSGGAHHVVTDRYQLSDYKLRGLNPLVHRVITPSHILVLLGRGGIAISQRLARYRRKRARRCAFAQQRPE